MKFIRGIKNIPDISSGTVLTIGNFDGIHLGHQSIINRVRQKASEQGLPSGVVFFEPQPKEFFCRGSKPPRLTSLHQKYYQFSKLDLDYLFCLRFSEQIASLSPQEFIEQILIDRLNVKHLIIGDDFQFGSGRSGNYAVLLEYSEKTGLFTVEKTPSFILNGVRVSSTAIRNALAADRLDLASSYLGRLYGIWGKVMHGKQLGRTLGFPTANINFNQYVAPVSGVYAVYVTVGGTRYRGMANIGSNPTVNGDTSRLEVFIFDFSCDIYGEWIFVELLQKIRSEVKFAGLDELREQLAKDRKTAEKLLAPQLSPTSDNI